MEKPEPATDALSKQGETVITESVISSRNFSTLTCGFFRHTIRHTICVWRGSMTDLQLYDLAVDNGAAMLSAEMVAFGQYPAIDLIYMSICVDYAFVVMVIELLGV